MRGTAGILAMLVVLGFVASPAAEAALYRAPGSLFTLTLPPGLTTLRTVAARGDLVESRGYESLDARHRVTLGVEIRRPQVRQDLSVHTEAWRADRRSLPNVQRMTEMSVTYGGVPAMRLAYSFAYRDDPAFTLRRDDVIFELEGHRVLVYGESGGRDGGDPTALMDLVMPTLTWARMPSTSSTEGLAERVDRMTNPPAAAAPLSPPLPAAPVVVAGDPPLTERTLAVWRQILEWTAGVDCTFAQERRLRRTLVALYEAGGERRLELFALEDQMLPEQTAALRTKLRGQFLSMSDRLGELSPDASVFADLFRDAESITVRADPPLTPQISETALETLAFLAAVVTEGADAGAGAPVSPLTSARFALEVRRQWLQLGRVLRTCMADLPRTWNNLRMVWEATPRPAREEAAERFRDRVRATARRPDESLDEGSPTLVHRILRIMAERPAVLLTLTEDLTEVLGPSPPGGVR